MEESENNNARARARIGARQKWFFGKNVIFCILVEISSFNQIYARAGARAGARMPKIKKYGLSAFSGKKN